MPLLVVLFLIWVVISLTLAMKLSGVVDWFLGLIWREQIFVDRAAISKRVKALCIDGDVPEETAILMVAKEQNITERELLEAFDAISAKQLKGLMKGDVKAVILGFNWERFFGNRKERR